MKGLLFDAMLMWAKSKKRGLRGRTTGQGTEIPSQIKILPKKVAGVGQGRQEQCMTFTEPSINTLSTPCVNEDTT